MAATESKTSISLLERLQRDEPDDAAWQEFVRNYGRRIYRWCRRWGLQQADAEDVTQTVLLGLVRQMRSFTYDRSGSFRAWLKTVAYRAWARFLEERRRNTADTCTLTLLESLEARDHFLKEIDKEGEREVLQVAIRCVRQRVQPHTWEAFRLQALDGLSGADAASRLGIEVGTAYVAKSKVHKMLREEIGWLEPGE